MPMKVPLILKRKHLSKALKKRKLVLKKERGTGVVIELF